MKEVKGEKQDWRRGEKKTQRKGQMIKIKKNLKFSLYLLTYFFIYVN